MSTNENDNPFAWAWDLGTEKATGEGVQFSQDTAALADNDTEALVNGGIDGTYSGPSSADSLGALDPTGLFDSDAASAVPVLVSGCRIIEEKEPRARRKNDPKVLQGDRFVCLWPRCESSRTFGRPAELQRHYADKHVHSEVYRCMALVFSKHCDKEYYRPDKFRYHMMTEHPQDTRCFCPMDLCNAGPYTFDLLRIHVRSHGWAKVKSSLGRATRFYTDLYQYPLDCPVKDCDTKLPFLFSLVYHLTSHDTNTRCNNRSAIRDAGYDEVTGHPLCPICGLSMSEQQYQRIHIEEIGIPVCLNPVQAHIYRYHWHEPGMLHKHRRDILKIDTSFGQQDFIKNKVFKDILATKSA